MADFAGRFRRHSVFNANLIRIQRPGARAVATAPEWASIGRQVIPNATPILLLWPSAPVIFAFDVEDTGPPIDRAEIGDPFAVSGSLGEARVRHEDKGGPSRILLINGSSRSEHSCPGEVSKSWRLLEMAKAIFEEAGMVTRTLDLSRLGSEYGRNIHPCKGCFSTAAALCHFPCSCYPNYSLGQAQDWMNDIYPMWIEAHGVMIVTPINWYQSPSPLKLMTDRLVCADGGNTDPSSTHGKDAKKAKELELKGWDYKRQLSGRLFAVVVHGDVEGARGVREAIHDWLCFTDMCPAGPSAMLDRYIGYWKPYATSHEELDADTAIQEETRNAARALAEGVVATRQGRMVTAGNSLKPPREK